MTSTYEQLRSSAHNHASREGIEYGAAAMFVMTVETMAMARDVPANLRETLAAAASRWFSRTRTTTSLQHGRLLAWRLLDESGAGGSAIVTDRVDAAVRALICVSWDEAHEGADLEDTLEFFAGLLDHWNA